METNRGAILAKDVIVATNGYTGGVTPSLRRRLLPMSSYIIVTEPLAPGLAEELVPHNRMLFDTKNYLWYWRRTPDDRLLFGGRASMWPTSVKRAATILQRSMVEVHPQLEGTKVEYAWGGKVAFTFDRMVHAGRADGVTYATGCCGSGVAIMPWLGTRIAEWVGGGAPPEIAVALVPARPGAVRGPGVVPAPRGRVLEGEGPPRRASGDRREGLVAGGLTPPGAPTDHRGERQRDRGDHEHAP